MTFTRTAGGISNHHLFTQATFTLYIEGSSNGDPTRAIDIAFWHGFFRHFYPDERISFRQLGGKPHVLNMADKIIANSIANSLCAVDSDYHQIDLIPVDDRIFRTYGYGVENDIYRQFVFEGLIRALLPGLIHPEVLADEVWSAVESTLKLDWVCLLADQIAACRCSSVLNRKHPQSDFEQNTNDLPVRMKRSVVRDAIKAARTLPQTKAPLVALSAHPESMPAHHYFHLVFQTFRRWSLQHTLVKYRIENFLAISLGVIQDSYFLKADSSVLTHYESMSARDISKFKTDAH